MLANVSALVSVKRTWQRRSASRVELLSPVMRMEEIPGSKLVAMTRLFKCSADYLLGLTDNRTVS